MELNQLIAGDCCKGMMRLDDESVRLAFIDPPYNIGYDYGQEYDDNLTTDEYESWCALWMGIIYRKLTADGSFWLLIGDEWAAELKVMARKQGFHLRSWIVWYYTFGVNSPKKFSRSHAHLFYFTKHKKKFFFDPTAVRVPSARALVYNDKRANPDGRLPDDTWILRPQELDEDAFPGFSDTWHIPRICGTFKQRQEGAANQLPEQLLGRIIRACSEPGDLVLDPMAGTATTLVVAKKLDRQYLGFELSEEFTKRARQRVCEASSGDPLDGPLPQGG